jgi:transcriptional regulator of met regulon
MVLTETQLGSALSSSKLGRYDVVKQALEWVALNRQNENFRKLTQPELINKALSDVVTGYATPEKMEELRKKMKKIKTEVPS